MIALAKLRIVPIILALLARAVYSESPKSLFRDRTGILNTAVITTTLDLNHTAELDFPGWHSPSFESTFVSGSLAIPLGLSVGNLGELSFAPTFSIARNDKDGPRSSFLLSASLSAGQVGWAGNMRQGISASLTSALTYDDADYGTDWNLNFTLVGIWHRAQGIGLAGRLVAMSRVPGLISDRQALTGLGSYLRGIVDSRISGVSGVFANLSAPVKLFDFAARWTKEDWFDFVLQAQPFLDAAIVVPSWDSMAGSDWLWTSGGLEFLLFPGAKKGLVMRASIGWDLQSVAQTLSFTAPSPRDGKSPYKYYLGTELAY